MGFFDDKLGPSKAQQPQQPMTPATAPGGWWQTPTQQARAQAVYEEEHTDAQQGGMEYAPRSSGLVKSRLQSDVADTCPRCNSYEYIKIAAEPASGSVYALPGASVRCMSCNYPGIDTSEGVIGGATGFVPTGGNVDATTMKVRERGGKNRNSFAGFNESSQAEGSAVVRIL